MRPDGRSDVLSMQFLGRDPIQSLVRPVPREASPGVSNGGILKHVIKHLNMLKKRSDWQLEKNHNF